MCIRVVVTRNGCHGRIRGFFTKHFLNLILTACVSGLPGVSLDYMKGLVTGLLRMIYERDSRRHFLPTGHWLMTDRFNMTAFVEEVVQEEENRHHEDDSDDEMDEDEPNTTPEVFGFRKPKTGNVRSSNRSRRTTPRLEVLQNMPFFIPFETRVQIFRTFVRIDQIKRRDGTIDPEMWRLNMHHRNPGRYERHQARIRREHEFEDAYTQFYRIKELLKEPIQITFVDKFDTEEVGIDGGGVTKEFLTTVTSQAFTPKQDLNLFIETEQHSLYPNPSSLEERMEHMREMGYPDNSGTFASNKLSIASAHTIFPLLIPLQGIFDKVSTTSCSAMSSSVGSSGSACMKRFWST